jgi:hypothetical protein
MKSAFVQPTIALCKQSCTDARSRFPELTSRTKLLVSNRGSDQGIAHRITDYLNDRDETGDLLFLTHAGFLRTPHWHRADTWNLFIDEVMEIAYHRKFRLKKYRGLLIDLFRVGPSRHERYALLEPRSLAALDAALAEMEEDEIYEHFADFIWRLRHDHWRLYVDHEEFSRFQHGESCILEVHGLLAPSVFEPFASVTIMGANLADSIMYKYFAREGCTFSSHAAINNALRYQAHSNGSRLLIKYLTENKWSKTLRNRGLHAPSGESDAAESICDVYMDLCQREARRHSPVPPLWIGNNDIRDEDFDGKRLKNIPHGMNNCTAHAVCCVFSALNPPQAHRMFLQDMCGMTEREVRRALLTQTAYQACGRGILRDPDSTGTFLLIVPDRDTAEDIAQYYPECRIEKLISDIEEPKTGRPSKYRSDDERAAAKQEQTRISQRRRRVRKNSLYDSVISDRNGSPADVRHRLVHVLHEWAESAPETRGTSAFAYSRWLSKSDRTGQGCTIHETTADLVAELRRRQDIVRVCKEAASLICPTLFAERLTLPDHLAALGISIDGPIRTKVNAIGCRGLWLDIEHGDMSPEDFARVFPDLQFIAYSSWSHTPEAPRYRIAVPSTQFVPAEVQALLLHTIVDRLEAAGWCDALGDGKKHGVDVGKLHEAAMFYLPSQRPDCFLAHFGADRKPLDPLQWVHLISDDLLASPPPPASPEVFAHACVPQDQGAVSSGCKDQLVQWATEYWRRRGCVKSKGRTQFWLLTKRLDGAGCDEEEMRSILHEQAGHATNPEERRGEIDRLLRDHGELRRAA